MNETLELVCCKKLTKIVPDQSPGLGGTILILVDHGLKPLIGQELFFVLSYSKLALDENWCKDNHQLD